MLDIGADVGALVVVTTAAELGQEIEISPAGDEGAARVHAAVRARQLAGHTTYGVVYPSLPAGDYTVWRDAYAVAGQVRVDGAQVTEYHWPSTG
jgi:hypothetical protein